jgi:hypothetical protein
MATLFLLTRSGLPTRWPKPFLFAGVPIHQSPYRPQSLGHLTMYPWPRKERHLWNDLCIPIATIHSTTLAAGGVHTFQHLEQGSVSHAKYFGPSKVILRRWTFLTWSWKLSYLLLLARRTMWRRTDCPLTDLSASWSAQIHLYYRRIAALAMTNYMFWTADGLVDVEQGA